MTANPKRGRPTGASNGFGRLAWTYDRNGNRQSETRNSATMPYVYSPPNWLVQKGSETRPRTANGNTLSTSTASFAYDGFNRLATSTTASETTTYTYNALGQRIKKINQNGLATSFHYGPDGELLYEQDQAGNSKVYVWLDGRPLARIDNDANIYYYHVDHLGTPWAMTNSTGMVVWKANYEPFGKATVTVSTVTNNLRLPGQYYDRETGIHYNYFRDYDPGMGRYVEADPIGLEGGVNIYGYANLNPLTYTDPSGLWPYSGNWCGPDWTGGLEGQYDPKNSSKYKPPTDALDIACRDHDICYWQCRRRHPCDKTERAACMTNCDRNLASSARAVGRKSTPLWLWMEKNTLPFVGDDSPNCGCEK